MESNHLTTRTYTTPTCTLVIANQEQPATAFKAKVRHTPVDFILDLQDPDRDGTEAITLQGQPPQLDRLHQVVSKYVAELVAKFPMPTTNDNLTAPATTSPESEQLPTVKPNLDSPRSGLSKNLPGLRANSAPPSSPTNSETPGSPAPSLFGKLFGRSKNRQQDRQPHANQTLDDLVAPQAISQHQPETPYLTGVGDRSLEHQLHLGNLATKASGDVLTLSAIQLFDLATVLDEYATEATPTAQQSPTTTLDRNFPGSDNRVKEVFATETALSRLPNLPKIPAQPEHSPVYYQVRRSRSSFMSAIPWAMASAIVVGVPLLLLDPKPNPLKDFTSKVKMPDLAGSKTSQTAKVPGDRSTKPGSNLTAVAPTVASPTPWQSQPVEPPKVNKPVDAAISTTQNPNKIGIAPLPEAIVGQSGQIPVTGSSISTKAATGIAPNPLSNDGLPSITSSIATSPQVAPPKSSVAKTTPKAAGAKTPAPKPNKAANSTTSVGQLPIEDPIQPGKLSVSKQPMLIPPADLAPALSPNNPINNPQAPLTPNQANTSIGFDPATTNPQPQKKTAAKVKPTKAATTKPRSKPSASPSGQPTFEPFTPVSKNPNLIDPEQNNNPQSSDPQPQPIVPNQPFPSKAESSAADPTNNPSLEETKRYFQGKWKADNSLQSSLQYVLQVGKGGVVRSVKPQGAAATSYLQKNKLIETGQKLVSPAAAGSSDQKIRVLLQPDGNVDTFIEP